MARRKKQFQSSPGPKAGCYQGRRNLRNRRNLVSILTWPSGRVLPVGSSGSRRTHNSFNPHPAFGPGATKTDNAVNTASSQFQSSPGLRAGCYPFNPVTRVAPALVSILTRPSGRVLRACRHYAAGPEIRFNPHPAFGPGATAPIVANTNILPSFNPHPARRPGATCDS